MLLFRVENPVTNQGLWYDGDGNFNPFILTLAAAKSRDLPMEFDPDMLAGGQRWYSACDNIPDLQHWFSRQDLLELDKAGYGLYQFDVSDYRQRNGHAVFTRSQVVAQPVPLPLERIEAFR